MSQRWALKYRGGIFYSHEDDFLLIQSDCGREKKGRGGGRYTEWGIRVTNEDGMGEQASGSEYKWREKEHPRP